ncbi:RNA polymerase sigma factor [Paenisporosarcina antarctica]|uniref:RNA polymerase sigma factor n=1 Tax=Paenisporosarcina antarctica TaxID=417367 RepID=A0A4P7A085_9BACL|nr:RNA polymerase sigma factor [Paenisporosarcina antarctica]QBP42182.1 RNA polymerase sigma factor [Paenisporosarcina antarctica]
MNEPLEKVYEEYQRYIYHLCLKLTRNQTEAEDLMQEVWVKVVRYQAYIKDVDHVKAWLTTICLNTFRDRYRKTVRRSKHILNQPEQLDVPVLDLIPSHALSTEDMLEKDDLSQMVQQKIAALDHIYKTTVLYFYVYQYSLVEIAALMKVSIGTVKSRLFRAKQRLKEMMIADTNAVEYLPA